MENTKKIKDHLFVILSVCIWGSSYAVKEFAVRYIEPVHIVFWGNFITAIIMLGYCLCKKSNLKLNKGTTIKLIGSGALGISVCQILINYGITYVGGIAASVIFAIIPCMCLIIDVFFRKKRVNYKCTLGVIFAFLGVILVVNESGGGEVSLFGYLLLLLGNVCWIVYCYVNDEIEEIQDYSAALFYQFLGATAIVFPLYLFAPLPGAAFKQSEVLLCMVFFGIINGTIAYLLFNKALKGVGVLTSNIISNFMPVISLVMGVVFLNKAVLWTQITGVGIVVAATIVTVIQLDKSAGENYKIS